MKYKKNKLLFIIPFAGGSCFSMKKISDLIDFMDVKILELPGRGKRINSELINNIDDIINDLLPEITHHIENYNEYYLFGHSMGAIISYELIHKLSLHLKKMPKTLFVSGRPGPSNIRKKKKTYDLPSIEFKQKLRELGGCPEEVLMNKELMNFYEPIIRADFEAIENYQYPDRKKPLPVKIIGLFGTDEDITKEEMLCWKKESVFNVKIIELLGNHFFIFDNASEISNIIKNNSF